MRRGSCPLGQCFSALFLAPAAAGRQSNPAPPYRCQNASGNALATWAVSAPSAPLALAEIQMRRRPRPAYVDAVATSRILISSGTEFEAAVGYSRAVRVGPLVAVSGTTGAGQDLAAQTREALRRIEAALNEAGAELSDVVRTRIFVTDIKCWREVATVHAEVFGRIRPAATMVEVAALITPELLVEIEADAYSSADPPNGGKVPSAPGR
jgi:enamine deaminase RidA (YjgF/YER057c/UK114 family)